MFSVELRKNVFAVYAGLIASGYDLFSIVAEDPVFDVIAEIRRIPWPQFITEYFARARKDGLGVNPYWPRAAMLLTASFYTSMSQGLSVEECTSLSEHIPEDKRTSEGRHTSACKHRPACDGFGALSGTFASKNTKIDEFELGLNVENQILDTGFKDQFESFPVSSEDKSLEVLEWLLEFPVVWREMSSIGSFGRLFVNYRLAMDARVKDFHKVTGDIIDSFVSVTGVAAQSLPNVCVIPNPLQASQVADYVSKGGLIYIIVAEPRPSSIIHEFLHKVFEPGIRSVRDKVLQFSHLLRPVSGQMMKMQYAWEMGSPDSWLRVFEENLMRAAAIWIELTAAQANLQAQVSTQVNIQARAHTRALSHARDGFAYVPVMVKLFFEEWKDINEIGGFIEKVLWACDGLV